MLDRNAVVLVVDDILSILEELLTLLDLHDIPASGAQTLSEVTKALEQAPDIRVIVSDIRLRQESGLEIPQIIRDNAKLKNRSFKYIFVSGDTLQADQNMISDSHSFLTKPVKPRTLITLVSGLLDTQST